MKILPYRYTSPNFRAFHECDVERKDDAQSNKKNFLVHQSGMFRYENAYGADEKIISYLQKQNRPLEIVSAGCSYGEEPYSYALALDGLGVCANISAFDLSRLAIQTAAKGNYLLTDSESKYIFDDSDPTPFKKAVKSSLYKNFNVYESAFNAIYKKDDTLENCKFFVGDVARVGEYFDKNSKDLILCRYVLYHLMPSYHEYIIRQFYDTLKPGGLLVFAPDEYCDYEGKARSAGFKRSKIAEYIFQKPYSVNSELVLSLLNPMDTGECPL